MSSVCAIRTVPMTVNMAGCRYCQQRHPTRLWRGRVPAVSHVAVRWRHRLDGPRDQHRLLADQSARRRVGGTAGQSLGSQVR